ncbi:MAG: hypothetical protein MUC88_00805 [Planctomycetes bacterium]|jgi:hypothetical protein|nr:hypothetical protein [Planctomycetota bacterium]
MRILFLALTTCLFVLPAQAKYSGGSGTAQDPYQIATAADLIALGETPGDYDKHFVMTADIDLDPNLPGRKVFDKAVIAPDTDPNDKYSQFQGTPFTGVFDGDGHTISHLTIKGGDHLGLFGRLASGADIRNVRIVGSNIVGSGWCAGGLVGYNYQGTVTRCSSTGSVGGKDYVGGLVGGNVGCLTCCCSASAVKGYVNPKYGFIGGLVGDNYGAVASCYSTGAVSGVRVVGGLAGLNFGSVTGCYSVGSVNGNESVGGLVGSGWIDGVTGSFWDVQTSGQATSAGGGARTTAQMQAMSDFVQAGWDFVGETANGTHETWQMPQGGGYPILAIFSGYAVPRLLGCGTPGEPYLIHDAKELGAMVHYSLDAYYRLMAPIDLSRIQWDTAVIWSFAGTFDGNGLTVSNLSVKGGGYLGFFGQLGSAAKVQDLSVIDANIAGSYDWIGTLAGRNQGDVMRCHSVGSVTGRWHVGGFAGHSGGSLNGCWSAGTIKGDRSVGGLVGSNDSPGFLTNCHSTGAVEGGDFSTGGLVGDNTGVVSQCFSTGAVSGMMDVGGLVGMNDNPGSLTDCYSTGGVLHGPSSPFSEGGIGGLVGFNRGDVARCFSTGGVGGAGWDVGGLVGCYEWGERVALSFWDTQTSGQTKSAGGTGKTTAEMQIAKTFLDAGWDFVGETKNGTADLWWILEGKDYPRLWWELPSVKLLP